MSAGEAACRKFQVSGAVQGVFFRASARERARRLGLSGWIRNLADGRVEALASGTPEALDEFARWLARGPDRARVTGVASETSHEAPSPGFEIR